MYELWGWVWFSGKLQECRNVFLVLTPNEYERWGISVGVLIYVNNDDIISAYVDVYVAFWDLFQV